MHNAYVVLGFNWIDLIIVLLLLSTVVVSRKIGSFSLMFVILGFFGMLFLSGWLFRRLLPIHDPTLMAIVNGNLVLISSAYTAMRSLDLSHHIRRSIKWPLYKNVGTWLGVTSGLAAMLIVIWLLATAIGRMPFAGLSNSVNDARIVQLLYEHLPPVPAIFTVIDYQVNPNAQPQLLTRPQPNKEFAYSNSDFNSASFKAKKSIVRITGFGCGGISAGSGFVIGSKLVATNAHVIAGVKRPIIKYMDQSYEGVPVYFNANLDFAILRVETDAWHNFTAPPLTLTRNMAADNSSAAVMGYPGGNYYSAPGIIRGNITMYGRNIYGMGLYGRNVYEIQTQVRLGSSGSPVVLGNGLVAGVIFAKSDNQDNYGYALAAPQLAIALHRAEASYRRVSTGTCIAN